MNRIFFMIVFFCFGTALAEDHTVKVGLFSIFSPREISVDGGGKKNLLSIALMPASSGISVIKTPRVDVDCLEQQGIKLQAAGKTLYVSSVTIKSSKAGRLFVGIAGKQHKRPYAGSILVRSRGGKCLVTNVVGMEEYVSSVACHEIRGGLPEAFRAQAVLVRTWAMTHGQRHSSDGQDFCDLTHCQVYTGSGACNKTQLSKLEKVRGMVLKFGSRLADVAYFSTCGGRTADACDIWGKNSCRGYLAGVDDGDPAYCRASPHFRWHLILPKTEVCRMLTKVGSDTDCSLEIVDTGVGGWVKSIRIFSGGSFLMTGEKFRMLMGRTFGWGRFKSSNFVLNMRENMIEFMGKGLGHGVGMCQYGAMNMAAKGKSFRDILVHYFPHTKIESLSATHVHN